MKSNRVMIVVISLLLIFSLFFENSFKLPIISEDNLVPTIQEQSNEEVVLLNDHNDYKIFGQINPDGTYNLYEFTRNPITRLFAKEDFHMNYDNEQFNSIIQTLFYSMPYEVQFKNNEFNFIVHQENRENSQIISTVFLAISLILLIYLEASKKPRK